MRIGELTVIEHAWELECLGTMPIVVAWLDASQVDHVDFSSSAISQLHGFSDDVMCVTAVFGDGAEAVANMVKRFASPSLTVVALPHCHSLLAVANMFFIEHSQLLCFIELSRQYGVQSKNKATKFDCRFSASIQRECYGAGELLSALCREFDKGEAAVAGNCSIVFCKATKRPLMLQSTVANKVYPLTESVDGMRLVSSLLVQDTHFKRLDDTFYAFANKTYEHNAYYTVNGVIKGV